MKTDEEIVKGMMPSQDELREMATQGITAAKAMADGSDSLAPHLFVYYFERQDGKLSDRFTDACYLAGDFNDGDSKRAILAKVGANYMSESKLVVAVNLVCEAWISTVQAGSERPYLAPSKDPQRKEVILSAVLSAERQACTVIAPITRDQDNNIIVGDTDEPDYSDAPLLVHFFLGYLRAVSETTKAILKNMPRGN